MVMDNLPKHKARPRAPSPLIWSQFTVVLLVSVVILLSGSAYHSTSARSRSSHGLERRQNDDVVSPTSFSPTQQNPQRAPAVPVLASLSGTGLNSSEPQLQRRGALLCGPGQPCIDDSCCGTNGKCGYGPDFCASGNCVSNCNSTAMCGKYSFDGKQKCGMNLCCSAYGWCGTDELHCDPNPTANNGMLGCQQGFGLCKTVSPPSCGTGSGTTKGRTVGYYQASNTRDRLCNRISPSQNNLSGLTHLFFAFAKFDPASFAIVFGDPNDAELVPPFTALQSKGVKTWIAIGGWDFSNPGTSTYGAWSNMVSSSANRAKFITSLGAFMKKWKFQGVDLDWEYPAADKRGGKLADTVNFAALLKEMKAAFGRNYGISLTLAPDYWYLRGFDAKAMEPYVDFFGFMAYDLHGSWDSDVKALGSKVRGQADIADISIDTLPLWFDDLNPSKINFGLAYYGRGYTLASPSCNTLNCAFKGPSKPGICTNYAGVMSLLEIQNLIKKKNLKPTLLAQSMMKQITWEDQWIGYDDADTIKMKKAWADGQCFGGTMIWSVDFNSGSGSGDTPTNTTDGTCGPKHDNTVCGDWATGSCCSAAGHCGNSVAHCGSGCQSGDCAIGSQTTDGTCGVNHGDSYCGDFAGGACCSLAGYCGGDDAHCGKANCQSGCPTTDGSCGRQHSRNTCLGSTYGDCCSSDGFCGNSDAHCGAGCQSGKCLEGAANMTMDGSCGALKGIICGTWPQGSCCSSSGWCGKEEGHCGIGCQSGPCEFPVVVTGTCKGPDCVGGRCTGPLCVSSGCKGPGCSHGKCKIPSLCIPLGCIGSGCSDGVCVGSACTSKGCHGTDCGAGRCKGDKCISTGCEDSDCDPGSGICRGPNCNRHSCTGRDCVDGVCIGVRCIEQLDDFGGGCTGNGCPPPDPDDESCTKKNTASTCTTTTSSSIFYPATTWKTWSFSDCRTSTGCSLTDSSSTTTITGTVDLMGPDPVTADYWFIEPIVGGSRNPLWYTDMGGSGAGSSPPLATPPPSTNFISCKHQNQDPGRGITQAYCVCSGSTFAQSLAGYVTPENSCGYTTMPTKTLGGDANALPKTTDVDRCQVCSIEGHNNNVCTSLSNCVPKTRAAPPAPTSTPSGSLCFATWSNAVIDGSVNFNYGVFKPGDACNDANSKIIGGYAVRSSCDLTDESDVMNAFHVCGKNAKFVRAGPVLQDIEYGQSCPLQLQIDGVNYPGELVGRMDRPCGDDVKCMAGIAFGSALGIMIFKGVPICQ